MHFRDRIHVSIFAGPSRFALPAAASLVLGAAMLLSASAQTATPSPSPTATATPAAAATPSPTAGTSPTAFPTASASPTGASPAPTAKDDLITIAQSSGNFKTFLKAVEAAGLTSTLQKPGPFTVFAPTDTAFSKLPAGALDELLKPENKAKLVATLSYHVATGKYTNADLSKMDEVRTLQGTEVDVDASTDAKVIEIDEAKILGADIEASNGVLHAIDSVLHP